MNIVFIFGADGNLGSALGLGWSVEPGFAWAVGAESVLTLPLPGDAGRYAVRFDLHAAVFPPTVAQQRLTIMAGDIVLIETTVASRTSVAFELPLSLTTGQSSLTLKLLHPDAARPSDYGVPADTRQLALCFHTARVALAGSSSVRNQDGTEAIHGIVIGHATAHRACNIASKLPFLAGRVGFRFVDVSLSADEAADRLPPGTLDEFAFVWMDMATGTAEERAYWTGRVSKTRPIMPFCSPSVQVLWPFGCHDPRARAEPGRYFPARYPFGDRIALTLQSMNMPDDVVYLMYEMAADSDPVDLDRLYQDDRRRWLAADKQSQVKLAEFLDQHFRSERLFKTPYEPAPFLIREVVRQIVLQTCETLQIDCGELARDLDVLLDGYTGTREELPVYRRVAQHFDLAWWSPDLRYRWANNVRTYREYTLDYIRWTPWRP